MRARAACAAAVVGLSLTAAVLGLAPAGARAIAPVKLGACDGELSNGRATFEPRHIEMSCQGERQPLGVHEFHAVDHIAWAVWNRHDAFGNGIARIFCGGRTCHSTHRAAHLHAWRPRRCPDGARIFTRLAVHFRRPVHGVRKPSHYTRDCPTT